MQPQFLKEGNLTKCAKISWYIIAKFKWALNNGTIQLNDVMYVVFLNWPMIFCKLNTQNKYLLHWYLKIVFIIYKSEYYETLLDQR